MPVGYFGQERQQQASPAASSADRKRLQAQLQDLSNSVRTVGESSRDSFNVTSERCSAQERLLLEQQKTITGLTERLKKLEDVRQQILEQTSEESSPRTVKKRHRPAPLPLRPLLQTEPDRGYHQATESSSAKAPVRKYLSAEGLVVDADTI